MSALLKFVPFSALSNWSVKYLNGVVFNYNPDFKLVKIGDFLTRNKTTLEVQDNIKYKRVTIKMNNGGVFLRNIEIGSKIGTKNQFLIKQGQFILSKIDARNGAFGVVTPEVDNAIITGNFWTFDVDTSIIEPDFLSLITTTKHFLVFCQMASNGTTGRHYLQEEEFLKMKIPLPSVEEQKELVISYHLNLEKINSIDSFIEKKQSQVVDLLFTPSKPKELTGSFLNISSFKSLQNWSVRTLLNEAFSFNDDYKLVRIGDFLKRNKTIIEVQDKTTYKRVTIKINNGGVFLRNIEIGSKIGTKTQFLVKQGQFLLSKIDARNGAFGVATEEVDNAIITGNFWTFDVDLEIIYPNFFALIATSPQFIQFCKNASNGTTGRHYLQEEEFLNVKIPLPSIEEQKELLKGFPDRADKIKLREKAIKEFEEAIFSKS
jgi:restriction endonuclease S subunit